MTFSRWVVSKRFEKDEPMVSVRKAVVLFRTPEWPLLRSAVRQWLGLGREKEVRRERERGEKRDAGRVASTIVTDDLCVLCDG